MTHQQPTGAPARPADVDTGFWLWLIALPLLLVMKWRRVTAAAGPALDAH